MSKVRIDRETLLVYLSNYIAAYDNLSKKFEEIYKTDIERFYLKALHSKQYTNPIINNCSILSNFRMKRIFGVLLAADEDEALLAKVEDIIYSHDRSFKDFVKKPTIEYEEKKCREYLKAYTDREKLQGAIYFPMYLAINKYGTDTDNEEYQVMLEHLAEEIDKHEHYRDNPIKKGIQDMPNPFEFLHIDEKAWKVCKKLKNGGDIFRSTLVMENQITGDGESEVEGGEIFQEIKKYMKLGDEQSEEAYEMAHIMNSFVAIAHYFDFSPYMLLKDISLTKEEQLLILKCTAFVFYNLLRIEKMNVRFDISLSQYFSVATFYILIKSLSQTKQYFEENNNETMFSQIQYYREENERHDEELDKLRKELQEEREKNDLLRQQLQSQGTTTDTKPFMEEISSLNRKVKELQEELDTEREKTDELNTLREFVFSIKSEYVPESDETDLKELIKDKKIIIVGGHIEWRNKLKRKYPSIITMDGHNATSDFTPLSSADLVLLNTSNMSHKVYYKVIETLRRGTTKFDYIGRSINQELYEKEIADIIKKYA